MTGSIVAAEDVQRPTAVERGAEVTVELVKGSITARWTGVALGSASIGERLEVSLADGTRTVRATVVRADLVRIVQP